MQIDLVVLILQLPQVFEVDSSRIEHLFTLGVYENNFLVLFQLLACLDVLLAVLIREVDGDDLGLGFFDLLKHKLSFRIRVKRGQGLVQEGFGFVWEG